MLKNYFNVAIRNLLKHKLYSSINILGLSTGLTCFLMIALFVKDELSYDLHHPDAKNIYRMDFSGSLNGNEMITAVMSAPAAETMKKNYPEVADAFRFRGTGNWFVKRKGHEQTFKEENVSYADPNFFEFWSYPLLKGDPKNCLSRPRTLVMDETTARKIFGDENPVGQTVVLDNEMDYEVTGVFKDFPRNSHFHFNIMLTMKDRKEARQNVWIGFNFNTYLKLTPGTDPQSLEAKFPDLIRTYVGPEIKQYMNSTLEEMEAGGDYIGFSLFPLTDIHLYSDKLGDLEGNGDIKYVYIFSAIAVFILILACINFMNLTTARSSNRAKEVGIRKVMGAYRTQLIRQFLSEAILISFISTLLAFTFTWFLLPQFNELAAKQLHTSSLFSLRFIGIMVLIMLIVGFAAGSYPAFYLSGFKPIEVLKGKLNLGFKSGGIRSMLVVVQFTVSIVMIIGTVIVFDQLSYIRNKKVGFDRSQVLMVHDAWILDEQLQTYKNEALRHTGIKSGTIASFLPVGTSSNNNLYFPGTNPESNESYIISDFGVDHDYIKTLGMEIVAGRNFSRDFPSDSAGIILNEAAVEQMGLEDPIGTVVSTYDGWMDSTWIASYKVIGVVKDFHFRSLRNNITPLAFVLEKSSGYISFKIAGEDIDNALTYLEEKWEALAPGQPFAYSFLDERFNRIYKSEQRIGRIFGIFASLAIFIACLGLLGLASFTAEQKTKEIGIRKVLGASVSHIVNMLSFNFLKLVLISFAVASPIAYFAMKSWLDDFVYRTDIGIGAFIIAGMAAIAIAWMTMGLQSWRAARVNPINSLRNE